MAQEKKNRKEGEIGREWGKLKGILVQQSSFASKCAVSRCAMLFWCHPLFVLVPRLVDYYVCSLHGAVHHQMIVV